MRPKRGGKRFQDERRREPQTRINEMIRVREILLIDEEGDNKGVVPTIQAQRYAEEKQLDLVEISPTARPPVCRVMDYGKWKYEQNIKEKEARKNRSQVIIKEIKFRPKIGKADYETKMSHVKRFLEADDKVKVTIMFRGREVVHHDLGRRILERVAKDVTELGVGIVEQQPNLEGRNMTMMIGPTGRKAKPTEEEAAAEEATTTADETTSTEAPAATADATGEPEGEQADDEAAAAG